MESGIINWINSSHESVLEALLQLSNNRYFISKKSIQDFSIEQIFTFNLTVEQYHILKNEFENFEQINEDFQALGETVDEIIFQYEASNLLNKNYEDSISKIIKNNINLNTDYIVINSTMIKELEPLNRKCYFNPSPPVEISHLLSGNQYEDFIYSLNGTYDPLLFIALTLIVFLTGVLAVTVCATAEAKGGAYVCLVIFGSGSIILGIYSILFIKYIRYVIINKKIDKFNKKIERNQIPLQIRLIKKSIKFPQTGDFITLEIYYDFMKNNDFKKFLSTSNV